MKFIPSEHEILSEMVPICVNYQCELCGEGNMIADPNEPVIMFPTNPPKFDLRTHICDKCDGTMKLPKTYPYIEWISKSEYQNFVNHGMIKEEV